MNYLWKEGGTEAIDDTLDELEAIGIGLLAAAWLAGSAIVSTAARHKEERKIEAIFGIGSIPPSSEG